MERTKKKKFTLALPRIIEPHTCKKNKGVVSHCGLAIYMKKYKIFKKIIKSIRQKKNYGNSNISPCKEDIKSSKKKPLKRNQNPSSSSELYKN
jgi:hypothetical protein